MKLALHCRSWTKIQGSYYQRDMTKTRKNIALSIGPQENGGLVFLARKLDTFSFDLLLKVNCLISFHLFECVFVYLCTYVYSDRNICIHVFVSLYSYYNNGLLLDKMLVSLQNINSFLKIWKLFSSNFN